MNQIHKKNFIYDKLIIELNKKNRNKKYWIIHMCKNEYIYMLNYSLQNYVKSFYKYKL